MLGVGLSLLQLAVRKLIGLPAPGLWSDAFTWNDNGTWSDTA